MSVELIVEDIESVEAMVELIELLVDSAIEVLIES